MNKNLLALLAVILVIIAGVVFINNQNSASVDPQNTNSDSITEESMEEENSDMMMEEDTTDAMMTDGETITLTGGGFEPANITVDAGTEIIWVNESGAVATVNSDDHPTHLDNDVLNLGNFEDGEELSVTIDEPGTYGYHDHLNPERTGTIVVE